VVPSRGRRWRRPPSGRTRRSRLKNSPGEAEHRIRVEPNFYLRIRPTASGKESKDWLYRAQVSGSRGCWPLGSYPASRWLTREPSCWAPPGRAGSQTGKADHRFFGRTQCAKGQPLRCLPSQTLRRVDRRQAAGSSRKTRQASTRAHCADSARQLRRRYPQPDRRHDRSLRSRAAPFRTA